MHFKGPEGQSQSDEGNIHYLRDRGMGGSGWGAKNFGRVASGVQNFWTRPIGGGAKILAALRRGGENFQT